jgi:nucleotidyltransferase/DNA polymerase involved in DNA repair
MMMAATQEVPWSALPFTRSSPPFGHALSTLRKSSGSETTFATDLTDPAEIEGGVVLMAEEVWVWCEKANAFGRTVTVKIKHANFLHATRSPTLVAPVSNRPHCAWWLSCHQIRLGTSAFGIKRRAAGSST